MAPAPRWLLLAGALAGLAGCYRRVEVPLASPGGAVACFGDDHLFTEPRFSEAGRAYCIAACQRNGFQRGPSREDVGGTAPRLNPGVPTRCL